MIVGYFAYLLCVVVYFVVVYIASWGCYAFGVIYVLYCFPPIRAVVKFVINPLVPTILQKCYKVDPITIDYYHLKDIKTIFFLI